MREEFPHREGNHKLYMRTQDVPDCGVGPCDRSPEHAYQIGYWQDIVREDDKALRRLRLTKWTYWCSRCNAREELAPHWWGRAIRGDILEAEEE
jgi:hypothetical protein